MMEVINFTFVERAWVSLVKEDGTCTYTPSLVEESCLVNQVACLVVDQWRKIVCEKMKVYHIKDHNDK